MSDDKTFFKDGFLFLTEGHYDLYLDALKLLKMVDAMLGVTADAAIDTILALPTEDERRAYRANMLLEFAAIREPYIKVISSLLDLTVPYDASVVELKPSLTVNVVSGGDAKVVSMRDYIKNR